MPDTRSCTYEDLYYEMWEISQRYSQIAQFRVIGKSHDERMIPMVELGKGTNCIFCLSGLTGLDRQTPMFLIRMMQEYVKAWESGWKKSMKSEKFYKTGVYASYRCSIPMVMKSIQEISRRFVIRSIGRCFACRKYRVRSIPGTAEALISERTFLHNIISVNRLCSSLQVKMRRKH